MDDLDRLPRYVVLRLGPAAPPGWEECDGVWLDLGDMPTGPPLRTATQDDLAGVTASPTGRYETREDGVKAEVYEISAPQGGDRG